MFFAGGCRSSSSHGLAEQWGTIPAIRARAVPYNNPVLIKYIFGEKPTSFDKKCY
jgi:hypothetical protein